MYVRLYREASGKVYLQQLLTLKQMPHNGKVMEQVQKWENVSTMGDGQNEAYNLPISSSCGIMLFESRETIFSSVSEGHKEVTVTYSVSALDVYKISPKENGVQVFTKDKLSLYVNMPYHEFTEMMISLLNNYKLIKFGLDGKIIK
jgi:hypothetical protein